MKEIVSALKKAYQKEAPTYQNLGQIVKTIDVKKVTYKEHLPPLTSTENYSRNIMLMEPMECVLLHWHPKAESAIHFHADFWGYVLVLEGCCDNIGYTLHDGELIEQGTIRALEGGIIDEPAGIIHKITNPSETEPLVTVHFYYPALESLDNLVLFNENGTKAVLNANAKTAAFTEPEAHFKLIEPDAFKFIPFEDTKHAKSHHIYPIIPKPSKAAINTMIGHYYAEQAEHYDLYDFNHPSRRKYTEKINTLITEELDKRSAVNGMLALACGTGRRAAAILEKSKHHYNITGVDLSTAMSKIARSRNITTITSDWLEADLGQSKFDACTFLYAFGHLTCSKEREQALTKIAQHLNTGGILFLDVFNLHDKHEWGAHALRTYEQLNLSEWGYEQGDVFYKKTGAQEVAFLHYFEENGLKVLLENAGFSIEYIKHIGYVYRSGELLSNKDEGSLFVKAVKR